ncbi:MAG TPA: RIP metalloprotease RseP [Bacteroidales bacterium]|nr:RIP metalloprotease RseP [Bacteroidales bacterium]
MDILIKTAQLLLSLSILVIIHELGHFLFAKLFKTRVEKFYLFFDPWFSVFKFTKGETEYGVGWLPLGGYVKISGMIDESMDKEQMALPPQPHEFRSKPAWQRLLIMIGGVLFNFILAIGIYAMILFAWGEKYLPVENAKYGIYADSLGRQMGLQNGDIILKLDETVPAEFHDIVPEILLNSHKEMTVLRNNEKIVLAIPEYVVAEVIKGNKLMHLGFPFIADRFSEDSGAEKAGIKKGDRLLAINGQELPLFFQYAEVLGTYKSKEVLVKIDRNGEIKEIPVLITDEGKIGIFPVVDHNILFDLHEKEYGFFASIPAGISKGYTEIGNYLKQFKLIFNPETEAYKSVGGFIAIGNIFPPFWDWHVFWSMTALLSIMLGVVNILPIPALDGGHVLFLIYELVAGRKPSDKFLEYAQIGGMVILLSLLIFANGNDIVKLFK